MSGKAAIRRLRCGVVPADEIEALSVGYDAIRERVLTRLSSFESNQESPQPLFIRGEWGTGKSHFIAYVRAACRLLNVACSGVSLNARTHPLNYPQRFYLALCANLELGPRPRGLKNILAEALLSPRDRPRIIDFARSGLCDATLLLGIDYLLAAAALDDEAALADSGGWSFVLGSDLSWGDYGYLRQGTLDRLASFGELSHAVGASGLVLFFDEAETIDQLWNIRSRIGAYNVMGRLCQNQCTWCIFGITKRFERQLQEDFRKEILSRSDLSDEARWFLRSWRARAFDILDTPVIEGDLATELARRTGRLYRAAHSLVVPEQPLLDHCVDDGGSAETENPADTCSACDQSPRFAKVCPFKRTHSRVMIIEPFSMAAVLEGPLSRLRCLFAHPVCWPAAAAWRLGLVSHRQKGCSARSRRQMGS